MKDGSRIAKVEVTSHQVCITLENGVVLDVSSNDTYFHFSLGRVELPVHIGHYPFSGHETNNTFDCMYREILL